MKEKLILVAFGSALAVVLAAGVLSLLRIYRPGTSFASLDDLRRQMAERDDRDVRPDESVSLRSLITPHPSDAVIYELLPGADVKFQGVRVRVNRCGMRGPDRPVAKPADVYRVALLGDSFAFGWGVEEHETFASVLEKKANAVSVDGRRVEVLNFGVPGYSTFQEVESFLEKGLDFSPDLVLVYFIENDFQLPFFIGSGDDLMTAVEFAKKIWNPGRAEDAPKREALEKLLNPDRSLRRLGKVLKAEGVPLFVAVNPGKGWKESRERLSSLRDRGVHEVVMWDRLQAAVEAAGLQKADLRLPTDAHPSAAKHALLGAILAEDIVDYRKGVYGVKTR